MALRAARSRRFLSLRFAPVAVLCLAAVGAGLGATTGAQQRPVFRSSVDLVHLDVSVLDKDRRPVRGLTAADFTVFENKQQQEVALFEPVEVPGPEAPSAAWMRDVTPDTTTNEAPVTRLWLVVVDDAVIPTNPYAIKTTRQLLIDVLDRFGPEDLVTVVFTADSRPAQDFTNDRSKLLVTLNRFNPGWQFGGEQDAQFDIGSYKTVLGVMDAMVAIPDKRKAMIWISKVPPLPMVLPQRPSPTGTMVGHVTASRKMEIARDIFEQARKANVPIYPVSPTGEFLTPTDTMLTFANMTKGHAYVNSSDGGFGMDRIFEENSAYYLVGYYPKNAKMDGTERWIDVRVNRPDVEVRTRSFYDAPKGPAKPPSGPREIAARAIASPVYNGELPIRATAAPFAVFDKPGLAAVAVTLGVAQSADEAAGASRIPVAADVHVTAFTTEGDNKGTAAISTSVVLRGGRRPDTGFDALARLDLPPGRFRLRVAVHREDLERTGTVMVDVIVPDFVKEPASMSGVALSVLPERPASPREALQEILPFSPTAQRDFSKSDIVTAFFELYQRSSSIRAPATVRMRVTDEHETVVATTEQPIDANAFQPRGIGSDTLLVAPVRSRLPIDQLSPGRFLVTFEVGLGATTLRRDVQLRVR